MKLKEEQNQHKFIIPIPSQNYFLNKNYLFYKDQNRLTQFEFIVNVGALILDDLSENVIQNIISKENYMEKV